MILCIASRKRLAKTIATPAGALGYVVLSSNVRGLPRCLADHRLEAAIIDWEAVRGDKPAVIRAVRSAGAPVVVITSHLNTAFLSGEPLADVYLEKPCSAKELLACVSELIRAERASKAASRECSTANAAGNR